jgi:hypothetical protein
MPVWFWHAACRSEPLAGPRDDGLEGITGSEQSDIGSA